MVTRYQKEMKNASQIVIQEHTYINKILEDTKKLKLHVQELKKKESIGDLKKTLDDCNILNKFLELPIPEIVHYETLGKMDVVLKELYPKLSDNVTKLLANTKLENNMEVIEELIRRGELPKNILAQNQALMNISHNIDEKIQSILRIISYNKGNVKALFNNLYESIQNNKDQKIITGLINEIINKLSSLEQVILLLQKDYDKGYELVSREYNKNNPEKSILGSDKLPSLDKNAKIGYYDVKIVIRYNYGVDIHTIKNFLEISRNTLQEAYVNPEYNELLSLRDFEYLRSRLTDKQFLGVKEFTNYALENLYRCMIMILENNHELLTHTNMIFKINITPLEENNASFMPDINSSENMRIINLTLGMLFKETYLSKDYASNLDYRISGIFSQNPNLSILFGSFDHPIYQSGNYRNSSLMITLYHEFIHSIDPYAKNTNVTDILPKLSKELYGEKIQAIPRINALNTFFSKTRAEALTLFSEFFIQDNSGYINKTFMTTFPIKEITDTIKYHMEQMFDHLDSIYLRNIEVPIGYSYQAGYLMAMIIAISKIFENNIPAIVISKEELNKIAPKKFPMSADYLWGKRDYNSVEVSKMDVLDRKVFEALNNDDLKALQSAFIEAGIMPITVRNFKEYYKMNTNFYVYKFDKRYVMQIFNLIKLSGQEIFNIYTDSCHKLGIESFLDDKYFGDKFMNAVKKYNKELKSHNTL